MLVSTCDGAGSRIAAAGDSMTAIWFKIPWLIFLVIWCVGALRTKPIVRRDPLGRRLLYAIPTLIGFYLLFTPQHSGPLSGRLLPSTPGFAWLGWGLTVLGLGLAIWARVHLGGNWSGAVTIKVGHELIRTGPYRRVRHPIYTGVLLASLGALFANGERSGLAGMVLLVPAMLWKIHLEERNMDTLFGPDYADYRRRSAALLPGVY